MPAEGSDKDQVERMIQAGLRAQLQSQSLLTGLLFVNLDFKPGTPVRLIGGEQQAPEIPTLPSGMEQLQESAGDIAKQLPDVVDRLNRLLAGVDNELQSTSGNLTQIVGDVAALTASIRENRPALEDDRRQYQGCDRPGRARPRPPWIRPSKPTRTPSAR